MLPAILALAMTMPNQEKVLPETPAARAKRMKWFKEARFGLFIHWGVYAVPAGKYGGRTNHAEWIMETGKVPLNEYEKWRDQFNPTKFDATEWASLAKEMGVKYV
ncbi:MAG TPA: alpha-L-fucosidase, partial [Fimbriimonadaceae bacterium]|nr:alpha-L-fucosidase [Fimbriimonadaceae bacterium]